MIDFVHRVASSSRLIFWLVLRFVSLLFFGVLRCSSVFFGVNLDVLHVYILAQEHDFTCYWVDYHHVLVCYLVTFGL